MVGGGGGELLLLLLANFMGKFLLLNFSRRTRTALSSVVGLVVLNEGLVSPLEGLVSPFNFLTEFDFFSRLSPTWADDSTFDPVTLTSLSSSDLKS